MAQDINKWIGAGRLVRDAELSYTNTGYALLKFSIAVNRRKKHGDQWIDEANFFDVTVWGKRGEALAQYMVKGQQLMIEGELIQQRWEKEGQKRSKVSIEANNIQLVGGNKEQQPQQRQQPIDVNFNNGSSFESDIPF